MADSTTSSTSRLESTVLARGLTPDQVQHLARLVNLRSFAAGSLIAPEGQTDVHLYEVLQGSLAIVKHRGTADETLLATLQPGDFAHELGFLDGTPRYASLLAASDAQVLTLSRDALESLIDSQPRILYRVMCQIVAKVHHVQTRLSVQAQELTNYVIKQHGRY